MNRLLKDLEFKVYTTPLEKAGKSGERRLIRGYASVGDVLDRQNEVITLGALMRAREDLLENHTIFYEHKHSELPIGKTIAVDVDEKGLLITVELSKGSHADSVWTLIQEGILDSFSIGGRVLEAEEKRDDDGNLFNEITRIELFETSVVGLPANPAAKFELLSKSFRKAITEEMKKREVSNKMAKENKETEKEVEKKDVEKSEDTSEKTQEKEIEKTEEKEVEKSEESTEKKDTKKETEEVKKSDEAKEEKSEEKEEDKVEKAHTNNATDEVNFHWHEAAVDEKGNGETTTIVTKEGYSGDANHTHPVVDGVVEEADGHPHELIAPVETSTETETDKSEEKKSDETNSLEEKSSDKESKEKKEEKESEVEEKSFEEIILEKVAEIIEALKVKKESKKSEEKSDEKKETSKENTEEALVETAKSEDKVEVKKSEDTSEKSEDVSEEKKEEKETEPEKETLKKVVKTEDTSKEEKSEEKETPARKGEAIIAETPYATEGEEKKIDKVALQKARDKAWCNIIFDK